MRHYSRRTEEAYVHWIRRYILFHGKRHPSSMGAVEITAFLTALATREAVAAATQNQAFSALLFLYRQVLRQVLRQEVGEVEQAPRARSSGWRSEACGVAALRRRVAPAGVPRASREGPRLRSTRADGAPRKGAEGSPCDASGKPGRAAPASPSKRPTAARGRSCRRSGARGVAGRARPEVSERCGRVAVAVRVSGWEDLP